MTQFNSSKTTFLTKKLYKILLILYFNNIFTTSVKIAPELMQYYLFYHISYSHTHKKQ